MSIDSYQQTKEWNFFRVGPWLAIFFILGTSLLITWKHIPLNNPEYPMYDAYYYKLMSQGEFSKVYETMTRRILHPATTGALSRLLSLDLEKAYFVMAVLSALVFLIAYLYFLKSQINLHFLLAIPILFTPPFLQQLLLHYHPCDLFYAALFTLFVIFLTKKRIILSFIFLILLYLTRESTILLSLPLLVLTFWRKERSLFLGTCLATIIGMIGVQHFMSLGKPNIHNLSEPLYLLGKVISNSFRNFLGMHLYVNTQDVCIPKLAYHVPSGLSVGLIKEVGFCYFDPWWALFTINSFLTLFGLGPLVCFLVMKLHGRKLLKKGETWLLATLFMGSLSFAIGPAIGNEPYRMMVYGWPAFWLSAPYLYTRYFDVSAPESRILLALHVLLAWLPTLLGFATDSLPAHRLLVLAGAILIHISAWRLFIGKPPHPSGWGFVQGNDH